MSYVLYINHPTKKARLHNEDCSKLYQHDCSNGDNGDYKYYNSYDKAWKKMDKLERKGYDCADCYYCGADGEYECEYEYE